MSIQFNAHTLEALAAAGLDLDDVSRVVSTALREDLRYGPDATTAATVANATTAVAELTSRGGGTLAGIPLALAVFDSVLGAEYQVIDQQSEGSTLQVGRPTLVLSGNVRGLLTAERTALNLLCHASGVATTTAHWSAALAGTGCVIRDSRKTLPGLRLVQKYAVRCGGGVNHRFGLGDAVLIKDNHVLAAGSVVAALDAARARAGELSIEVEVDDFTQLDEALSSGADEVLLDNFTPWACARAVRRRDEIGMKTRLEASGGLRLDNAREYAESGVDYLAVGALTHSAAAVDIGMDLR